MKLKILATGAAVALLLASCQQVDKAVKGVQTPPGWQMTGQSRTDMSSEIQYLGASADGLIIVRMPNGQAQVWKPGP
jgi:hypothetical protein